MVYRPSAWVMLMMSMSRFIALIYEHMLNLSVKSKARSLSVLVLSIIVFLLIHTRLTVGMIWPSSVSSISSDCA